LNCALFDHRNFSEETELGLKLKTGGTRLAVTWRVSMRFPALHCNARFGPEPSAWRKLVQLLHAVSNERSLFEAL